METSTMIRQLRATAKKHKNVKLHTFDTNITAMCTDVANRLEFLEKEKQEIRAKTIDEFVAIAEQRNNNRESIRNEQAFFTIKDIRKVAERMKAGAV